MCGCRRVGATSHDAAAARRPGCGTPRGAPGGRSPPAQDPLALRAHLAGLLPGYMLPRGFTHLDAFPLNANRKIDRRAVARILSAHG
ncbi:hypothetical protein [Streptomyces sp. NPDC047061]|uniref:hypothetical protein n=1 Tax=Streptomyces sp. NPDC047061 TaxID=3154605 RepID=UPI0033D5D8EF